MNAKLSLQQKQILVGVYLDFKDDRLPPGWGRKELWGIPWKPWRYRVLLDDEWTKSDAAVMSRSLHRLVQRGLVEPGNWVSDGRRTICVKLTSEGEEVAKRLVKQDTEDTSRLDVQGLCAKDFFESVPRRRQNAAW